MKIGILTFHRAYNYGARLQCYSLQKRLQNSFPSSDISIINYNSQRMYDEYHKKNIKQKISFKLRLKIFGKNIMNFHHIKRIRIFDRNKCANIDEINEFLNIEKKELITNSIEKFNEFVNKNDFDVIIVGSDAIWNDNQSFAPNPYLLNGVKCKHKLSYAASAYGFDYRRLELIIKNSYKNSLNDFKYIGVRDEETFEYVNSFNIKNVYHNCDPTLFLDLKEIPVNTNIIEKKLKEKGIDLSRPMIGVMGADWLAKEVKKKFGKKYQIICLFEYNKYSDFYLDNLTPFEWAVVFKYFDATFTHYFHGTLFSLKNLTLTFSIEKDNQYNIEYKTKIYDLLDRMNLLNLCYYRLSNKNINKVFSDIEKVLEKYNDNVSDYKQMVEKALNKESMCGDSFFKELEVINNGQ